MEIELKSVDNNIIILIDDSVTDLDSKIDSTNGELWTLESEFDDHVIDYTDTVEGINTEITTIHSTEEVF